jgi:hypothetical protein
MFNRFLEVFLKRLFASTASCASLIGLILTLPKSNESLSGWQWLFIAAAITFYLINGYLEFKTCPKSFNDQKDINKYMLEWISKGSRVAIFTRDMTWSGTKDIKDLLYQKARNHELSIYLPEITRNIQPFIEELQTYGASIYTYPELSLIPESRFTIINKDRNDAQVAVGRSVNGKHTIEEFTIGDHPVFAIANDLTKVICKYNELVRRSNCEQIAASKDKNTK